MNRFPTFGRANRQDDQRSAAPQLRFLGMVAFIVISLVITSHSQTVKVLHSFSGSGASQYPAGQPTQGRDGKIYVTTSGLTFGSIARTDTGGSGGQVYVFTGGVDGSHPQTGLNLVTTGSFYGATPFGGGASDGIVFSVTASGVYSVVHSFAGGADGESPEAPPIIASDGNLYGTTHGGIDGATVYKYTPGGSFSTIYQFDSTHGSAITAPLVQGTDANLYGVANAGGTNGFGSIFKLSTKGIILQTYSFPGGIGGAFPVNGLIQANDGNFYGATGQGGNSGFGTIFRMDSKGVVTVLYSFQGGTVDGANPVGPLTQGTDGNLYGTTGAGGSHGFGTIYQISLSGSYAQLFNFDAGTGENPSGLLQHTNGKFYGNARNGGAHGYGSVFTLDMGLGQFITFVRRTGKVGQSAQILGQGLTGSTSVTFNGVPATSFSVVSDTYMTAVVPSGATTGPIVVTTPSGPVSSNVSFRISQ